MSLTLKSQAAEEMARLRASAQALVEEAAIMGIIVRIEPENDRADPAMGHYSLKVDVYPGATLRKDLDAEAKQLEATA